MQRLSILLADNAAHHEAVDLHLFRSEGSVSAAPGYVMEATCCFISMFVFILLFYHVLLLIFRQR